MSIVIDDMLLMNELTLCYEPYWALGRVQWEEKVQKRGATIYLYLSNKKHLFLFSIAEHFATVCPNEHGTVSESLGTAHRDIKTTVKEGVHLEKESVRDASSRGRESGGWEERKREGEICP